VVLYDTDAARVERVVEVLAELARGRSQAPRVHVVPDLAEAVRGADFIFSAIRVGGLAGRTWDERAALQHGLLGQETTGAGGLCYGLRTVPVALALAAVVRHEAPDAWVINFTNPAGMVTEAVQQVLGDHAVGICDSPSGLCRRVAAAVGREADDLWFDYFGLNHLGWLKGVRDAAGAQLLDGLLEDDEHLNGFEEGRLFGGEWLRSLGMIPNEYLYYFYYAADTVSAIRGASASRGRFLLEQQRAFYARADGDALADWRATRHDRERTYMAEARSAAGDDSEHDLDANAGYEGEAMAVLEAIALNSRKVLILNTANRSSLPFLDERAVVEVPCVVGRAGPVPVAMGQVPAHARALIEMMKDVERTTIDAALLGSRELAVKALSLHPLVPSVTTARDIFDGYRRRLPALQEAFA